MLLQQAVIAAAILDEGSLQCLLPREIPHAGQLVVAARTGTDVVESGRRGTVIHRPILHSAPARTAAATLLQRVLELAAEFS